MFSFSDVLLTVDFDRTLTGPDSQIPSKNLEAISWFMDQGGTFTVNTGRSLNTFRKYLNTVPVNAPFLLYNGSAAYEKGQLVYLKPIALDMWQVMDRLRAEFSDMNLEIQGLENHYLVDEKPDFVAFYDALGWCHAPADRNTDLGPFLKFSLFGAPRENRVATMFDCSDGENARFLEAEAFLQKLWGDKIEIYRAAPRIIDVHAKGVSKLQAARDLQARLGKKLLVCVGDAENDLTMLRGADYAFCPADGVVAKDFPNVCPCGEGAVAEVIYKKIPEILEKHS